MGKLKRDVCVAEDDCLLFRVTRADCIVENDCAAPARGRRTEVSAGAARDDCIVVTQRISPARVGNGQFREPGGAGATNEEKQKAFVPPPAGRAGRVPRESFRGKCRIPPRRFCVKGTGRVPPAAERVARLWAPPAPSRRASRGSAGGGFPGFADSTTWDRSATPLEHPAEYFEFRCLSYEPAESTTSGTKIPRQPPGIGLPCSSPQHKDTPSPSGGGVGEADGGGHPSPAHRGGAALRAAEGSPTRAGVIL